MRQTLIDKFQGMMQDFEAYPVDDMIANHKVKLGEATVPKGLAMGKSFERADQE